MRETSQQQTLSVRISDTLWRRLERARQLMASKTGKPVSTSAIAKRFLESARDDHLDVADLLADSTTALVHIRRKGDAQHVLSRAEWTVLVHFVQLGLETFSSVTPNAVPGDAIATVLDAFLAVANGAHRAGQTDADVVRRTVTETRRRVRDPTLNLGTAACLPLLARRNLSGLLEDEPLAGGDAISRALRPYWPALWRLAARGHYAVTDEPVREPAMRHDGMYQPPIPPITEGPYTLSFAREHGNDLCVLLSFSDTRGPLYPIRGYPAITEFRAMLTALAPDEPTRPWSGHAFVAWVAWPEEQETVFWFRAHDNGITFGFSLEEWQWLRTLVRRAWDLPDVRMAWDTLADEYGEL